MMKCFSASKFDVLQGLGENSLSGKAKKSLRLLVEKDFSNR